LAEFTLPESPLCILEELQAAGYPHLEVTEQKRHLQYECCLVHEVVTKRLPALDDIRKGLGEVNVMGITLNPSLLERFPELQGRVFPACTSDVSASARIKGLSETTHGFINLKKAIMSTLDSLFE
jgi:hypothetical protein